MYSGVIHIEDEIIEVTADSSEFTFLFSDQENDNYLRYGWSIIEEMGSWTDQKSSLLFLDFEEISEYYLDLTMRSMPEPDVIQEVEVFLNGSSIGRFILENIELTEYTAVVPAELLVEEYNILEFRSRYLISPYKLGISEDLRNLATYFSKMELHK